MLQQIERLPTLPFLLFCFLCYLRQIHAVEQPRWMLEENRVHYREYEVCLRAREKNLRRFQSSNRFHGVLALSGSVITLKCFECLDPADATAIEDAWKPNESLISRKLQNVFDKIKQAIQIFHARDEAKNIEDMTADAKNIPRYYWEFLSVANESKKLWRPIVDMHEPVQAAARVSKIMRNFFNRDKLRYAVGNHFELEIRRSNISETGWYRCVRRTRATGAFVANGFFVDVVPDYRTHMIPFNISLAYELSKARTVVVKDSDHFIQLELLYHNTSWTQCNRCGRRVTGVTRQQFSCFIRSANSRRDFVNSSNLAVLQLVPEIPCLSVLLPESIRAELKYDYDVVEMFRPCQMRCPLTHNETRLVEGYDDDGSSMVVDRLPPGEYAFDERLPPLAATVRRKVIRRSPGESIVLDCGSATIGQGLIWRKDHIELNSSIMSASSDSERILIGAQSRLIIRNLESGDQGIYSCSSVFNETEGIFLVFVSTTLTGTETRALNAFQLSMRFVAVLLLALLFCRVMQKAPKTKKKKSRKKIKKKSASSIMIKRTQL